MDRRRYLRFTTPLRVKARIEGQDVHTGVIRDFSRDGFRAIFDILECDPQHCLELDIQRPLIDTFIPARGEVRWKKSGEGQCEVGIRLLDFSPYVKGEILDFGYRRWVKEKI